MKSKRVEIDFSKHKVYHYSAPKISIHFIKIPGSSIDCVKFINSGGILAVTGDYGNWIFCREFHPGPKEGVSEGYWHEKLSISSSQVGVEWDSGETKRRLIAKIEGGAEEYGYTGEKLEKALEYYRDCLEYVEEHELDYTHFAYRNCPNFMDGEDVIFAKDFKYWLKAVFDAFDEICRRMKEGETFEPLGDL